MLSNMKLIAIAAVSMDGVIGIGEKIPWHIPEDFKHFRETTMGHTLIMGYNTFKTLPPKALEGRRYIVLSKNHTNEHESENIVFVDNIDKAMDLLNELNLETVFVAGGSMVYEALLGYCDEAIITWVHETYSDGDKKFPTHILFNDFQYVDETPWMKSKKNTLYKITKYKTLV